MKTVSLNRLAMGDGKDVKEEMKKLICAKDIEALAASGKTVCYIDSETIVTPSAADTAKNSGITMTEQPAACMEKQAVHDTACASKPVDGGIDSELIYSVLKTLLEKGMLSGLPSGLTGLPYDADCDPGGLKVVRGNTVKMDVFETGDPKATAFYQELVSKDESKMSAGFLVIDHSRFAWELTYEEIDYVIEGTLTIEINGKTYTAHPGDVLFVPSGSNVIWGSPDKAKVFYSTYPANWADLLPQ